MSEKRKITAQFLYFGLTCFYRTSVEMADKVAISILHLNDIHLSNLDKIKAMCQVICADMQTAHTAKVCYSKKKKIWKANGYFQKLDPSNEYI